MRIDRASVAVPSTPIRQFVRFVPRRAAADQEFRHAAQILHEHDAQRDRDSPEFSDRKFLNALVRGDKAPQRFRIEAAVRMRHEGPRDSVDARKTFEMAGRKLRQFAVEAGRQIVANFAKLLFYDKEIIHEPFGRGDDGLFVLNCARDGAVIFEQDAAVFEDARNERTALFVLPLTTACAAARLSACCSRRSILKSSDRIGLSGSVKIGAGI